MHLPLHIDLYTDCMYNNFQKYIMGHAPVIKREDTTSSSLCRETRILVFFPFLRLFNWGLIPLPLAIAWATALASWKALSFCSFWLCSPLSPLSLLQIGWQTQVCSKMVLSSSSFPSPSSSWSDHRIPPRAQPRCQPIRLQFFRLRDLECLK